MSSSVDLFVTEFDTLARKHGVSFKLPRIGIGVTVVPLVESSHATIMSQFNIHPDSIPLTEVESSNIAKVGYDGASEELQVIFRTSAKTYTYYKVPPEIAKAFLEADSKGTYFMRNVRDTYAFKTS